MRSVIILEQNSQVFHSLFIYKHLTSEQPIVVAEVFYIFSVDGFGDLSIFDVLILSIKSVRQYSDLKLKPCFP